MPTYEYECTGCGLVFEETRPITAPARQRCPKCRHKVNRLITGGAGIVFKGSGFYINDSRGKTVNRDTGPSTEPSSSDPGPCADSKGPETKSD